MDAKAYLRFAAAAMALLALTPGLRAGEQAKPPDPRGLLGKEAPDFSLDTADGGGFRLSGHRDSAVVVLTFWVSRFPGCAKTLPVVVAVTGAFKDKGVVFCAVNVREDAGAVRKFQEANKLQFPSALDKDGAVAGKYLVGGMPHTVVVDKDGTVQSVQSGFTPDLKSRLTRDLETLTAGKKLVKPPKGKEKEEDGQGAGEGGQP